MILSNIIGKLRTAKTTEEILEIGVRHQLLLNNKIDLSGTKLMMSYQNVDLNIFLFHGVDITGSRFINCVAEGAVFDRCILDNVYFAAEKGQRVSMVGTSFRNCSMNGTYFGARTLNLSSACFADSELVDVKFMLADLRLADFSFARLKNVQMRSALLDGAKFKNALLERVSFEKASLSGADFTGATFTAMEYWGDTDFTGAIAPDSLLYQHAIIQNPVGSIDQAISEGDFTSNEKHRLSMFRDRVANFAANVPEAMLIATEYEDLVPFELFVRVLKQIKSNSTSNH